MSETDRPRPPSDAARSDGAAADLSANRSVESIDEVCQRWRSGETPDARAEIDRRRQQGVEVTKTEFVDLAYEAYAAAAEQGLSVDPRQYPEQFPTFHESVRRSIEVHQFIDDELGSATPIEDPMWPEVESQILDFYLIAELGRGVRARAYLAKNTRLGSRLEVVKVARTEDSYDEAESQGRLSHDNIVPVLHVKRDPITNLTVIIMPYLGRVTLADIIRDFLGRAEWPTHARSVLELAQADDAPTTMKPKPALNGSYLDAAIELGRQIAAGLSAAHDEGVVHGDMKPSNVLVTPAGRAMLLDFNLAQDEQRQWQLPRVGGTLPYLSTEQLQARYETQLAVETTAAESAKDYVMADRQTDLFSLGVILYELLTGKYPFSPWPEFEKQPLRACEQLLKMHRAGPPPVCTVNPEVGQTVSDVVSACLSPDPDQRSASANEVVQALRQAQLEKQLELHEQRARQEEKNRQERFCHAGRATDFRCNQPKIFGNCHL